MKKNISILSACFTLFMGSMVFAQTPIYQNGNVIIPHNAEGPRDANGKLLGLSSQTNKPLNNTFWYWKDASGNHVFCVFSDDGYGYQAKISDALAKSAPFKTTKIEIGEYTKSITVVLPQEAFVLTILYNTGYTEEESRIGFFDKYLNLLGSSARDKFYWNTLYKGGGEDMIWLLFAEIKFKEVFGIK
jgi:hypothetical protein